MKNLTGIIMAAALLLVSCSLFAHNGDFRKRDEARNQNNCPRQHRDGGDGNQDYQGEQYSGEEYQGENYQGKFNSSNCQTQQSNCKYAKNSNCKKQKSNCRQNQNRKKNCSKPKKDGKGPHKVKKENITPNTQEEAASQS